ncbi:hypothetical protein WICMUC_005719 [Wickerhamomyces mucosus]|uniref:FCP1 homology domain-containing protein n=1 Tax=Wickerhamomyces mucosus TaxID=1378264 RepID=A0A9P8P442_9ASCO|nr:hypothetical protein WICMUC_005719 [Wickerhamomyces mucosus]
MSFIESIFCCSSDDSTDSLNQRNNHNNNNNNNTNIRSKQQQEQQNLNNNSITQQPSKIKTQFAKTSIPNNEIVNGKRQGSNQNKMKSQSQSQSQSQSLKPDVKIYEATDSTIDTNDENNGKDLNSSDYENSKIDKHENDYSSNEEDNEEEEDDDDDDEIEEDDPLDDFFDLTKLQPGQSHAESGWLLDPPINKLKGRKCLILDLDETLVHSSFKYLRQADFVIPVDIDNQIHNVYVIKRPGVDEFMKRVGEIYEVVVFTASVSRYGDPLLDALDIHESIHHRLFRDSCYNYQNNYIKNLSQIGRPLNEIIILDNSPASYLFHPQHAIPISSWFSDAHDNELLDILPFLEDLAKDNVEDIGVVLDINL